MTFPCGIDRVESVNFGYTMQNLWTPSCEKYTNPTRELHTIFAVLLGFLKFQGHKGPLSVGANIGGVPKAYLRRNSHSLDLLVVSEHDCQALALLFCGRVQGHVFVNEIGNFFGLKERVTIKVTLNSSQVEWFQLWASGWNRNVRHPTKNYQASLLWYCLLLKVGSNYWVCGGNPKSWPPDYERILTTNDTKTTSSI